MGHLLDSEFAIGFDFGMDFFYGFMVVELGVAVVVVEGGGVFIMGHMWVHGSKGGGLPW